MWRTKRDCSSRPGSLAPRTLWRWKSQGDFHLTIGEFDVGPVKVVMDDSPVRGINVKESTVTFAVRQGEHLVELTH
jgi:hypothetical protein